MIKTEPCVGSEQGGRSTDDHVPTSVQTHTIGPAGQIAGRVSTGMQQSGSALW